MFLRRATGGSSARLYYEDTGGDGPAVVFSHGILMDHEMFEPQVEALSGSYRCITWDERFHGLTKIEGGSGGIASLRAAPPTSDARGDLEVDSEEEKYGSFTYWDSAADLVAILDDAGVEDAVLAGMSQGGFLSLRAALLRPERVRGLFLIDTQAGSEEPGLGAVYRGWAQTWAQEGPQDHLVQATVPLILSPAPAEKWTEKWVSWPQENVIPMIDALLEREDITDRLAEITCPAVVVHGTADPSIPMEKAEGLCAGLPGCSGVVRIEGGGHASNLSHPEEVNEVLLKFLATLG